MNFTLLKLSTAATIAAIVPMTQAPVYSSTANSQPYVYSTYQFPQTKATDVRHTLRLYVPDSGEKLVKLSIAIPKGLTVKNDIRVEGRDGRLVATANEVKNGVVTINFTTPLVGVNNLNIHLDRVNLWGLNRNYQLTATYQGRSSDIKGITKGIDSSNSIETTYSRELGSVEFRRF